MSDDFLTRMLASDAPVVREVSFIDSNGEKQTGEVHFRRITAAERAQILAGQKFTSKRGENDAAEIETEIDLGQNERQQHMLVAFSVCRPDGKRAFTGVDAVGKQDAQKIKALYLVASDVNKEDDAGKS